jgi:mRNA interferase MazF
MRSPDKRRPVVVLTRTNALSFLSAVVVAPITTTLRSAPTQVFLDPELDGVARPSVVNLDNLLTVQKSQIGPLVATLSVERLREVDLAVAFALGMDWMISPSADE